MARRAAAAALALALSGCAGLPIGQHSFLVLGVGVLRIDRSNQAVGISSRSIGGVFGCRQITIGLQESYCAEIPITGDVAIIERGRGPDQHLSVIPLSKEKSP